MPVWAIVALCVVGGWLLLTVIGHFLGPQGGPAVTRRDSKILERRANYDTPRKRRMILDAYEAAALVTRDARRLTESARYNANDAIIVALGTVAARLRAVRDQPRQRSLRDYADEQALERFGLLLGALVQRGVTNDIDEPLASYGLTPEAVFDDPTLLTGILTVRSLDHWPTN